MRQLREHVQMAAPTNGRVLIYGENGTGKELVARTIHALSHRRAAAFIEVNCAAIPEELIESELFGHVRGAFTGAVADRRGKFEVADGGTIFLDEIGEISLTTQVMLLRVLDTATFRRVGATSEIHVNVRVIAATNRDLEAMVRQKQFRQDLFYRLSSITVSVPALRERDSDIDRLADHFLSRLNERFGSSKRLSPAARRLLEQHDWPGNVRELMHAMESAMVVCEGGEILPAHLPAAVRSPSAATRVNGAAFAAASDDTATPATLEKLERVHIERMLKLTAGHRGQAAQLLGISERNLYRKLKQFDLV
jgi:two-component system, NtrC family, nitrogen regulation response regulator NtrX